MMLARWSLLLASACSAPSARTPPIARVVPPVGARADSVQRAELAVANEGLHEAPESVGFDPESRFAVSSSSREIVLWDLASKRRARTFPHPGGLAPRVELARGGTLVVHTPNGASVWSPDGRQLASFPSFTQISIESLRAARLLDESSVEVTEIESGRKALIKVPPGARYVRWVPDGRQLVVDGAGGTSAAFDLQGRPAWTCERCRGLHTIVGPLGKLALVQRQPLAMEVFDPVRKRVLSTLRAWPHPDKHKAAGMDLSWSPDGTRALVWVSYTDGNNGWFRSTRLYDTVGFSVIKSNWGAEDVFLSNDGRRVISQESVAGIAQIFDARDGRLVARFEDNGRMTFSQDASLVALTQQEYDAEALVVRRVDGAPHAIFSGASPPRFDDVVFAPNGAGIAATAGRARFTFSTLANVRADRGGIVQALSFSADGRRVNVRYRDPYGRDFFDVLDARFGASWLAKSNATKRRVHWSPEGTRFAKVEPCAAELAQCGAIVVAQAEREHELARHSRLITALTWSPNGREIAFGDSAGEVFVLDSGSGELRARATIDRPVQSIALDPRGRWIGIGYSTPAQYNTATPHFVLHERVSGETRAAGPGSVWSADGSLLVAMDGVHDLQGAHVASLPSLEPLRNSDELRSRDIATWVDARRALDLKPVHAALALALERRNSDRNAGADDARSSVCVSLSSDGKLVAIASDRIEIVRLRDRRRLVLRAHWHGVPVRVVHDERGFFDGDAQSLSRLQLRSREKRDEWISSGPEFESFRHPGLLAEFLQAR